MNEYGSNTTTDALVTYLAKYLYHEQLAGLIPLPYAIPTFALDVFINYVLLRHFKTPFYRLYVYSNSAQCFAWFTTYYLFRASKTPFFYPIYELIPAQGWIPTILNFFAYYAIYVNYFLEFLLTFNRFTVVAFPFNYTKLWQKIMPYLMLFTFLYPFLLTWHLIRTGATSILSSSGYSIDACECLTGVSNSLYYVIVSVIYGVSVASMNFYICVKLFQRRRKNESGSVAINGQGVETELSLFLFTCFLFIFATLIALCQAYIHFNIDAMSYPQLLNVIYVELYIEDIHVCLTPWFLVILSSGLRSKIRPLFCARRKSNRILFTSVAHSSQIVRR